MIAKLSMENPGYLKREKSTQIEKNVNNMEEDDVEIKEPKVKKTVKKNETEKLINVDSEFE